MGQLTVVFGAVGAGVAFALQEVITSIAGWIAISFGQFYSVGDRIKLAGIVGDVIDVSPLRTTLMECGDWVQGDLYNGRLVRLANSNVFQAPVYNYSADFPFLWDELIFPITYGCNRNLAKDILLRIAHEVVEDYKLQAQQKWQEMVDDYYVEEASVEPMVTLVANDNWMEYTLRYVVDYKKRRITKDKIFNRFLDEIAKTDGRVTTASATFQLVEPPVFDIRLAKQKQVKVKTNDNVSLG